MNDSAFKDPGTLSPGETFRWRASPSRPFVTCAVVSNERRVVTFDVLEGECAGQQYQRGWAEMVVYNDVRTVPMEEA